MAEEHKLLMVVMDAEDGGSAINDFTSKALSDRNISEINKMAIVIRPALGGPDWDSISKIYMTSPVQSFGTLFFNPKGVLVHRYDAVNEFGSAYVEQAKLAYVDIDLPTAQDQFDSLSKIRFSNIAAVDKLFNIRVNSVESTDDIIKPFIENTPIDSFNTFPFFYVLAKYAPPLGTRADSIFRGAKNMDSNWI